MEEAHQNRADSPVSNLDGEGGVICSGIEAAKNINNNTDNILNKNMTMQAEHENSEEGSGVAQDVLPGFSCDEIYYFTEQETDIKVEIQSTSPVSQIEVSQCVEQFIEIEDGMIVGRIDSDVEVHEIAENNVPITNIVLEQPLRETAIQNLLKICLRATSFACKFCNTAKEVSVNGLRLALHALEKHRFFATVEEIPPTDIASKMIKSLNKLEILHICTEDISIKRIDRPGICFECLECMLIYRGYLKLREHNDKAHVSMEWHCPICKNDFYYYAELLNHLCPGQTSLNQIDKFRCSLCDKGEIASDFRLMVHLRKEHDTCDVCLISFSTQKDLLQHILKHEEFYRCWRCHIVYTNKEDIKAHLYWKHGNESVTCKKCLEKRWRFVYHFCIPPSAFICEVCETGFSRAVYLRVHSRTHDNIKPHSCTVNGCSETFISKKLQQKHELKHDLNANKKVKPILLRRKKNPQENNLVEKSGENLEHQSSQDGSAIESVEKDCNDRDNIDTYKNMYKGIDITKQTYKPFIPIDLEEKTFSSTARHRAIYENKCRLAQIECKMGSPIQLPVMTENDFKEVSSQENFSMAESSSPSKCIKLTLCDRIDNKNTGDSADSPSNSNKLKSSDHQSTQSSVGTYENKNDEIFNQNFSTACSSSSSSSFTVEPHKFTPIGKGSQYSPHFSNSDSTEDDTINPTSPTETPNILMETPINLDTPSPSEAESSCSEWEIVKRESALDTSETNKISTILRSRVPFRESDLSTEELETDEDFYEVQENCNKNYRKYKIEAKKSIPTNETNEKDSKSSSTSDDTSEEDQSIVPNSYESKLSRASTSTGLFSTQSSSNQKLINKTNGCQQNQSSTNSISTKNHSKAKRYPKRRRASRKIIDTSSDESDYEPRVPPKRSNPIPTLVPRYIYPKKNSKSLNEKPVPIIRYKKYNQLPAPDPLPQEEKIKKQTELCTCEKYIEGSDMIQCDDPDCAIGWFHFDCVGIIIPPKNEWYCPNCR